MIKKIFTILFFFVYLYCQAQEIDNLKDYLGNDRFTIIGNELSIKVNAQKYPLNNAQYFIFAYDYKTISAAKKVGFEAHTIRIKKRELEAYKGQHIPIDSVDYIKIYYQNGHKAEYQTRIKLNFVEKEKLSDDFALINLIYTNNNESKEEKAKAMREYFADMYGRTERDALDSLIKTIVQ